MNPSEQLLIAEIQHLEKKLNRQHRSDLREFTMAALQGLCANPKYAGSELRLIVGASVQFAEAALAELEKRT